MASEGASGEHPPPVQTLATAVLGSVDTVRPRRFPETPENGEGSRPSCGQRVGAKAAETRCASIRLWFVEQQRCAARRCLEKNTGVRDRLRGDS